ncbi:MAG: indole-3-glycerol phosphate synthase TrpC [bacterium]
MENILNQIAEERHAAVASARLAVPEAELRWIAARRKPRSLRAALMQPGRRVIAELKRRSPSAGVLREQYFPAAIAQGYAAAGAAAISVLTEPLHFDGSREDLLAVRAAVELPILRKDFIVDAYQVLEAAAWGADAVLLIAALLNPQTCSRLAALAAELGLEAILEIHGESELAHLERCPDALVGVNNRDLTTLKTDLAVARDLAGLLPKDRVWIAESGLRGAADLLSLEALGYRGFLVGESFLRQNDPGAALRSWLQGEK